METIQKLIENACFGQKFKTRDGSCALFLRICSNSEYKLADFYVENWGRVQVNRLTGMVLPGMEEPYNDIIGLWE